MNKAKPVIAEAYIKNHVRLRFYSIKQAAYCFHVSPATIINSIKSGDVVKRGNAKGFHFKHGTFDNSKKAKRLYEVLNAD